MILKSMKLTIILLLFVSCTSIKSQTLQKSLENDILDTFIISHQIEKSNKQKILNNFNGLVTITDLNNSSYLFNNEKGIYKVSLNITHTTSLILLYENNNIIILDFDNKFNDSFLKILNYIKSDEDITKEMTIKYLERIFIIIEENRQIKNRNILEFND